MKTANIIPGCINMSIICKKRSNPSFPHSNSKASARVLCLILGITLKKWHGLTGGSSEESNSGQESYLWGKLKKKISSIQKKGQRENVTVFEHTKVF